MPDDLIAPLTKRGDHFWAVFVELCVDQERVGEIKIVGQLKQTPGTHSVAVVSPGKTPGIGLGVRNGIIVAHPLAESKMFNV